MKHQPPRWKNNWFEKAIKGGTSCICMLDFEGRVRFQNMACLRNCGSYRGNFCPQICLLSVNAPLDAKEEGIHFYPNRKIGNQYYDVAFLDNWHSRTIALYPLRKKHEKQLQHFKYRGLSRREMEVVQLGLKGQTNEAILKTLGISKATLKTHLNNIYKKIPEVRGKNWRGIMEYPTIKNIDFLAQDA